MEPLKIGEFLTLDNNQEYVVVEVIEQDGKKYLYLVRSDEEEVLLAEEKIIDNNITVETLGDKDKIIELTQIILERLKSN